MRKRPVLQFAGKVPGKGSGACLAVYDFSGIQSYIFGRMDRFSAPEEIAGNSRYIEALTEELLRRLQEEFPDMKFYSMSSGKLLCGFPKKVSRERLEEVSRKMQRQLFATTLGRLTFHFAAAEIRCIPENRSRPGQIPAGAFLSRQLNRQKTHNTGLLGISMEEFYDPTLTPEALGIRSENIFIPKASVMALKLDLDNLGAFFRGISAFDRRDAVSRQLKEILSGAVGSDRRITEIFAGGDDIFVLCDYEHYLEVICDIHTRLEQAVKKHLPDYGESFGLSGGAARVRNDLSRTPLLYYYRQTEEMLDEAKACPGKNRIVIDGCLLTWDQLHTLRRILQRHEIFAGMTGQEAASVRKDIRELRQRILNCDRSRKFLTEEERQIVWNIG